MHDGCADHHSVHEQEKNSPRVAFAHNVPSGVAFKTPYFEAVSCSVSAEKPSQGHNGFLHNDRRQKVFVELKLEKTRLQSLSHPRHSLEARGRRHRLTVGPSSTARLSFLPNNFSRILPQL
jgi:hypothetical protein